VTVVTSLLRNPAGQLFKALIKTHEEGKATTPEQAARRG
jgi:hypothetical protein